MRLGCPRVCHEGWKNIGGLCYENCPSGWEDHGLFCSGRNSKGQKVYKRDKKSMKPKCLEPVVSAEPVYEEVPVEVEEVEVPPPAEKVVTVPPAQKVAPVPPAKPPVIPATTRSEDPISIQIGEPSRPVSKALEAEEEEEELPVTKTVQKSSSETSTIILAVIGGVVVGIFIIRLLRKRRNAA